MFFKARKLFPRQSLIKKIKNFKLSKRKQFVLIVAILVLGMITTQLVAIEHRTEMVIGLATLSFILSIVAQREDLQGIEYLTLNILPVMFTVSVAFFYFLLPVRWLTRLPTAFLYGLGMYAIFLTENIYNIASNRSIQLLRAAHSVGLLTTLVTVFLLYDTVFSFHLAATINGVLIFFISFPLLLQSLWSMTLEQKLDKEIVVGSLSGAVLYAQASYIFSFWPINTTIFALFLTTCFYCVTGIIQQKMLDRLFAKVLREFIGVLSITFILVLITARWGG